MREKKRGRIVVEVETKRETHKGDNRRGKDKESGF